MGLLGKQVCRHCSGEAGMITKQKLADGTILCNDCRKKVPKLMKEKFLKSMTYQDYSEYLEFRQFNQNRLATFNITDTFFNRILFDKEKGWFVFDPEQKIKDRQTLLSENPDIFDAKALIFVDFIHGFFTEKTLLGEKEHETMRVVMSFKNKWYPYSFNEIVDYDLKFEEKVGGLFNRKKLLYTQMPYYNGFINTVYPLLNANNASTPMELGDKWTRDADITPYETFFSTLFQLHRLGVYSNDELDVVMEVRVPSKSLRRKIKNTYGG